MPQMTREEIETARQDGLSRQGIYLRKLRAAAGLTQREIAKLLDIEDGMIQHWERGRNPVALEHQDALARALGINPSVFVVRMSLFANPLLSRAVWGSPETPAPPTSPQRARSRNPTVSSRTRR